MLKAALFSVVLAVVAAACDSKAEVTVTPDKPGEVKLNGKDVAKIDVKSDGKGTTINGTAVNGGNVGINIGADGIAVTAPGVNVGVNAGGVAVAVNTADAGAQAEQIFTTRCSVCHGMAGKGDGPGAVALNPKPRNYTDVAWQGSVTDDQIAKTIVEGGAAVGKSPLMAPNADLKDKPDVVKALVGKVRSFKGK